VVQIGEPRRGVVHVKASATLLLHSTQHHPSSLPGKGPTPSRGLTVPETLFVEGDLLGQHVVDGPAELGGQDASRSPLSSVTPCT